MRSDEQFYLHRGGKHYGPWNKAKIRSLATAGKLRGDDRISTDPDDPGKPAREFFKARRSPPPARRYNSKLIGGGVAVLVLVILVVAVSQLWGDKNAELPEPRAENAAIAQTQPPGTVEEGVVDPKDPKPGPENLPEQSHDSPGSTESSSPDQETAEGGQAANVERPQPKITETLSHEDDSAGTEENGPPELPTDPRVFAALENVLLPTYRTQEEALAAADVPSLQRQTRRYARAYTLLRDASFTDPEAGTKRRSVLPMVRHLACGLCNLARMRGISPSECGLGTNWESDLASQEVDVDKMGAFAAFDRLIGNRHSNEQVAEIRLAESEVLLTVGQWVPMARLQALRHQGGGEGLVIDFDEQCDTEPESLKRALHWLRIENQTNHEIAECQVVVRLFSHDGAWWQHLHVIREWKPGEGCVIPYCSVPLGCAGPTAPMPPIAFLHIFVVSKTVSAFVNYLYAGEERGKDEKRRCEQATFQVGYFPEVAGGSRPGLRLTMESSEAIGPVRFKAQCEDGKNRRAGVPMEDADLDTSNIVIPMNVPGYQPETVTVTLEFPFSNCRVVLRGTLGEPGIMVPLEIL
jgi:hypothetical protein